MTKLLHLAVILLDIHLSLGFRDAQYSNIGRAPFKVKIESVDEDIDNKVLILCGWREGIRDRQEWFYISDEDASRVQVGKTVSLVKSRSVKHADPFAVTCKVARFD